MLTVVPCLAATLTFRRVAQVPAPVGSFDELYLSKEQKWLRNGIEQAGWTEPTPIQMQAIPALIEGRDILACAPTGSGKVSSAILFLSACYSMQGSDSVCSTQTGAFVIPLFARLGGPLKQVCGPLLRLDASS